MLQFLEGIKHLCASVLQCCESNRQLRGSWIGRSSAIRKDSGFRWRPWVIMIPELLRLAEYIVVRNRFCLRRCLTSGKDEKTLLPSMRSVSGNLILLEVLEVINLIRMQNLMIPLLEPVIRRVALHVANVGDSGFIVLREAAM